MNTGVVSVRYAKALLSFAKQQGKEDVVREEMRKLSEHFINMPEFGRAIVNPVLSADDKLKLLQQAAGGETVSDVLTRFFKLVLAKRRESYLPFMVMSYGNLYNEDKNIVGGKLVTAVPNEEFVKKLQTLVGERLVNKTVVLETKADPKLIGGFILQVEDKRLDASIASQLQSVKQQFIAKNRRII